MPIFSYLMFQAVHWAAKRGLRAEESFSSDAKKQEARRTGIRGETYAYWYLRRNGYVFVARNYTPRGIKGEIDLVGYDGKTLAFVEVRTRTVREGAPALPELSVTKEKQHVVVRTAQLWGLMGIVMSATTAASVGARIMVSRGRPARRPTITVAASSG